MISTKFLVIEYRIAIYRVIHESGAQTTYLAHFLTIQWANVGRIVANHNFILYNVVYYAKIHVGIDFESYTWIRD